MTADVSLKLFDLTYEFVKDKEKAKEFVSKIEMTIEDKFQKEKNYIATKQDLAEMETRINRNIYIVGVVQFIAIVSSVLAIVSFIEK